MKLLRLVVVHGIPVAALCFLVAAWGFYLLYPEMMPQFIMMRWGDKGQWDAWTTVDEPDHFKWPRGELFRSVDISGKPGGIDGPIPDCKSYCTRSGTITTLTHVIPVMLVRERSGESEVSDYFHGRWPAKTSIRWPQTFALTALLAAISAALWFAWAMIVGLIFCGNPGKS